MSEISPDRRRIDAEPAPEAEREAAEAARDYLACRLRLARALARIEARRAYHLSACSSIVQYGVRLGLPPAEARAIADLGRALEAPGERLGAAPAPTGPDDLQGSHASACGSEGGTIAGAPAPAADPEAGVTPAAPGALPESGPSGADAPAVIQPDAGATPSAGSTPSAVEEAVLAGRMSVANAALLGRLVAKEGLVRPGEDWTRRAETMRPSEFRRQVVARIEEVAQGAVPLVALTVHMTERAREDFHRARVIASRESAIALTEGQAFTRIVRFYLDARDDCRRMAGTGGRPGTSRPDVRGTRYIPSESRRAVLQRSGDRCEVPGCALDTFLEFAHVEPHASGGDRSDGNLLRLCHVHHTQFDADCLLLAGWPDGRPAFRDARGGMIGATSPGLPQGPRERVDALTDAVLDRREREGRVSEEPVAYGTEGRPAPVAPPQSCRHSSCRARAAPPRRDCRRGTGYGVRGRASARSRAPP